MPVLSLVQLAEYMFFITSLMLIGGLAGYCTRKPLRFWFFMLSILYVVGLIAATPFISLFDTQGKIGMYLLLTVLPSAMYFVGYYSNQQQ